MLKKILIAIPVCLLAVSCKTPFKVENTRGDFEGYPISSEVFTTLQRTIVADAIPSGSVKLFPYEVSKYQQNGYGNWHYGPGLASEKRLDLMPAGYDGTSTTNAAKLLNFFTLTDIHITDKETPNQAIYMGYKGGIISAYSATLLYSTHVLDAAVQTINALHKQNPLDFGISLGDAINSAQYNELRWYVDVLDGKNINPDSGVKDDPVPGPHNDYQDEYKAAGLDKSIPWYQAIGNHDRFWMGSFTATDRIRQAYTGENILEIGNIFTDPLRLESHGFYSGVLDGKTPLGDVIGAGPIADFATPPKVAADPRRRPLSNKEWMSEFFKTASNPVGHGFTQANLDKDFASYSFEPKSNIPIKVIVLDDIRKSGTGQGTLDNERYDWLVQELDKGQAEGKLMVIAAHIPIGVEEPGSMIGWVPSSPVSEATLISKLHSYPNFIVWIAGHRHQNTVTAFKTPDSSRPELGFWEIETPSLREFPQQFRTFEIVRNSDNTISIKTTSVDPAVKDGSPAAQSRSYGIAAQRLFNSKFEPEYNAELVKQLSPAMQAEIQKYGTAINK
ncbi:MAG TPA: TIGR03768 family metallophosphoesterase [Cyanobacteria bacterium UBA8530]|nr:TIGR03768 family metallophosphoesterase [Cyanobacteria bacterium UBA8530]